MSDEATAEGRRLIGQLARAALATASGPQDPLQHLATVTSLAWYLDQARDQLVAGARAHGASWAEIARALEVSRQAARQRWGAVSDDQVDEAEEDDWHVGYPFEPTSTDPTPTPASPPQPT